MTAQFREILLYKGERLGMAENPLRPYLVSRIDIEFVSNSTACWRGYVGRWEVIDDKLYLVNLSANLGDEKVGIDYLFPGQTKVFADWYSGEIRIPTGKMLEYVHMGYASIFEKDLFLVFVNGQLVNQYEVDKREVYNKRMVEEAKQEQKNSIEQRKKRWWRRLFGK